MQVNRRGVVRAYRIAYLACVQQVIPHPSPQILAQAAGNKSLEYFATSRPAQRPWYQRIASRAGLVGW